MVDFFEIRYDENFIWAKAYHKKTNRWFDVKVNIKEWTSEVTPDDYDSEVFKASGNLLLALERDGHLPEKYTVYWG